jgi:hypothetical protein
LLNDIWAAENSNLFEYSNDSVRSSLENEVFDLLKEYLMRTGRKNISANSKFYPQDTVTRRGVAYSTSLTSPGNSFVLFGDYPRGLWHAGQITSIFVWEGGTKRGVPYCFAVIDRFRDLSPADRKYDIYRQYPSHIAGKLIYAEQPERTLVPLEAIICHLAATSYKSDSFLKECLHILPLDRVRMEFLLTY